MFKVPTKLLYFHLGKELELCSTFKYKNYSLVLSTHYLSVCLSNTEGGNQATLGSLLFFEYARQLQPLGVFAVSLLLVVRALTFGPEI
jgi:hypothetical protein